MLTWKVTAIYPSLEKYTGVVYAVDFPMYLRGKDEQEVVDKLNKLGIGLIRSMEIVDA